MQSRRVVSYGSRQLKNHEQNYPAHNMELATNVFTLKAWRHYCTVSNSKYFQTTRVLSIFSHNGTST